MTPAQHARAKQLFLAACERPPAERSAFLADQCPDDPQLRTHVAELLRHHREDQAQSSAAPPSAGRPASSSPAGPESRFEAGSTVVERYRVVALLGRGGMGEVYRVDDLVLGQTVALKFLPQRQRRIPGCVEQLVAEVRAARAITNRHVCRVHDIHIADDTGDVFISMEYIDGEDLGRLLRRIGRLAPDKAAELARQVCVGLAAAHAQGFLHRDLKPANVMVDGQGCVRITDFGLAAPLEELTSDAALTGTPAYLAPELFAGSRPSVQSDLYALGLILYELFAGQPAFRADTLTAYARLHQHARPTPLSELVPDLPPGVERVIQRCLEKDPHDRPASALAVAADLPRSDPLALALAAGVTPSPASLAASGAESGLRPVAAAGLLAGVLAGLTLIVLLFARVGLMPQLAHMKPAGALAERAEQLADQLVPPEAAPFRAFGYSLWQVEGFFGDSPVPGATELEFAASKATPTFWYRASPIPLTPTAPLNVTFGAARTTLTDPPRTVPGMVTVVLDGQGALLGFEVRPDPARPPVRSPVDWTPCFAAAGLTPEHFQPVAPGLTPWLPADEQHAWQAPAAGTPAAGRRVEAAATHGRPTLFAVLRDPPAPATALWYLSDAWRRSAARTARVTLVVLAALGALPLLLQNMRRGRGDRAGALRLGAAVFIGRLCAWALNAAHTAALEAELTLLLLALLRAWFEAGLVWVFYMALEPHVRRLWPQTIAAWSGVLAGQVRTPRVARDTLMGTALGVAIVLTYALDRLVLGWLGWELRAPLHLFYALEPLLGARHGVATCLNALLATLYLALFIVTVLVLARVVVRRTWLAGLVTVAALMPMFLPGVAYPCLSWVPLVAVLAALVWAAACHGLVVVCGAVLVSRLFLQLPVSFVPGAPGWDLAVFVLLAVTAVAVFGFLGARRRAFAAAY